MRGRRKRAKTNCSPSRQSSQKIGSDLRSLDSRNHLDEEDKFESCFPVDNSVAETGPFASRCSVRLIHEVVSKFDSTKRDIVKAIGFEGILHSPPIKQFNRKFAMWLMSCVDEESACIRIGSEINISFRKSDVGHVLGIPSAGRRIIDARYSSREAKEKVLNKYLPEEFKELRSIKIVQEIIERSYVYPMSKIEEEAFRVAFVVFVASNLLCPSAKYDYACIDYWNAIQDPECISGFDWSEYVVERLIEAVTKLKQDIARNIKFPNITGCSIFLQVLYLDSLRLDGVAMPHNSLPRIRDFSYEKLRSMISADKNYARHVNADARACVGKLRDAKDSIYSWAAEQSRASDESRSGCLFAVWECAVAMVNLLNLPLEAAGPVFVAAADFQEQINSGVLMNGIDAIKLMSVLVTIMIPYSRGCGYRPSCGTESTSSGSNTIGATVRNGMKLLSLPIRNKRKRTVDNHLVPWVRQNDLCCMRSRARDVGESSSSCRQGRVLAEYEIGDDVKRSFKSVVGSLDGIPHSLSINLRVATAMSQFYSILRALKPAHQFDLNVLSPDEPISAESRNSASCINGDVIPSPWEIGYLWDISDNKYSHVAGKLQDNDLETSMAIVHRSPKYIQVSWRALRYQINGKSDFETDLFDALTRVLRQGDDERYSSFGVARWRYFFESDFMDSIMSGSVDVLDRKLGSILTIPSDFYDLSKTKLVFFPAMLEHTWVCFVWNIEKNVLSVFEPSHRPPFSEGRISTIERTCYLLRLALQTLSSSILSGVSSDVGLAEERIITIDDAAACRVNRSGVLCSLFCRCFDGEDLVPYVAKVDCERIAWKLVDEACELKDNLGSLVDGLRGG